MPFERSGPQFIDHVQIDVPETLARSALRLRSHRYRTCGHALSDPAFTPWKRDIARTGPSAEKHGLSQPHPIHRELCRHIRISTEDGIDRIGYEHSSRSSADRHCAGRSAFFCVPANVSPRGSGSSRSLSAPPRSMFPAGSASTGSRYLTFDCVLKCRLVLCKRPGRHATKTQMQFAMHDTGFVGDCSSLRAADPRCMRGDRTCSYPEDRAAVECPLQEGRP